MSVYIIDDIYDNFARSVEEEYGTKIHLGEFKVIRKLMLNDDYEADENRISFVKEADFIFMHNSFNDTYSDDTKSDGGREYFNLIRDVADKSRLVLFSNAWIDSTKDRINKTLFYRSLNAIVKEYEETGEINIDKLISGRYLSKQVNDDESFPIENSIEYNGPNILNSYDDFKKLENYIKNLDPNTYLIFNTDSMTPITIRQIALYIRLSLETINSIVIIPFIFKGEDTFENIVYKFSEVGCSDILFCEGSNIIASNLKELKPSVLTAERYKVGFLDRIKVTPINEKVGNHTLANHWGAFLLGNYILKSIPEDHIYEKERLQNHLNEVCYTREPLYLRYLMASNMSFMEIKAMIEGNNNNILNGKINLPFCKKKKILFIDDQDKEWAPVIKGLFFDADQLDIVGKKELSIDFSEKAIKRLLEKYDVEEYDLILLDLRLMGEEEETLQGENLSGLKLLRAILDINPGIRVIVFSSSNKAWNIDKAIDYGATGYYIKESPVAQNEHKEIKRSVVNFFNLIEKCFEEYYLVKLYQDLIRIEYWDTRHNKSWYPVIKIPRWLNPMDEVSEMINQLYIAYEMIQQAAKLKEQSKAEYAYIALEQTFEIMKRWDWSFHTHQCTYLAIENISGKYVKEFTDYRNQIIHKNKTDKNRQEISKLSFDDIIHKKILPLWKIIYDILDILGP